jgi:hypothetical protein
VTASRPWFDLADGLAQAIYDECERIAQLCLDYGCPGRTVENLSAVATYPSCPRPKANKRPRARPA